MSVILFTSYIKTRKIYAKEKTLRDFINSYKNCLFPKIKELDDTYLISWKSFNDKPETAIKCHNDIFINNIVESKLISTIPIGNILYIDMVYTIDNTTDFKDICEKYNAHISNESIILRLDNIDSCDSLRQELFEKELTNKNAIIKNTTKQYVLFETKISEGFDSPRKYEWLLYIYNIFATFVEGKLLVYFYKV